MVLSTMYNEGFCDLLNYIEVITFPQELQILTMWRSGTRKRKMVTTTTVMKIGI